jgi:cobalamin biosynthesis protein CobD/CbiB
MSSASGCLSIKLEKIGFYTIGYEYPLPSYTDIYRGIKLGLYVATTFTVLSTLLYLLVNHILSQVINYG